MKRKFLVLLTIITIFCNMCDSYSKKLTLINNTDITAYYCLLTDTVLNVNMYLYEISPSDTVMPVFVRGGKGGWNMKINKESVDSALHIFVFTDNKISNEIINNRSYKKMDFKVKDLDSLNWTVTIQ